MKKISLAIIFVLILGCATIKKPVEMTFNDCIYKCIQLSCENDVDGITQYDESKPYLIYLCGLACKEKAQESEWNNFLKQFEVKQDSGNFI